MPTRFFALCALFALFVAPLSAQSIVRSFDVDSGGTLELRLEVGGDVTITGGASAVDVEVTRDGRDADELEVSFDERGDRVVISSAFEYRGRHDVDVDYTIQVPSRFNINLELTGGAVSISGVRGTITGQTMGGELELADLSGEIDFQTMGGGITVSDSELDGKVHTMGGAILMENVQGSVEATTMGGSVSYRGVNTGADSETRIRTMGGDIELDEAPAGADVQTMGGDIEVGSIGEYLKAETMGGDIEVASIDGWIEATTMGGNIEVHMTGGVNGDRHVELKSMGGDIELVVPSGLSMDFDVEIIVEGRGKDASDYVIESDFEMDVSAPRASRGERVRLMAQGSVGGGDNTIRVRTVNGNVRILRDR